MNQVLDLEFVSLRVIHSRFYLDHEQNDGTQAVLDTAHVTGKKESDLRIKPKGKVVATLKGSIRKPREETVTLRSTTIAAAPASKTSIKSVEHLQQFLNGASAAQKAQVEMIKSVFHKMDADGDGLLSMSDVRQYFRAIGKFAGDLEVRKWISNRDIDQDGAVSLSEFVASYSLQLDPRTVAEKSAKKTDIIPTSLVSNLTEAFGTIRLGSTVPESIMACEAAEGYVRRILDAPSNQAFWTIPINDEYFKQKIGRLFGGTKLMIALGFHFEQNGTVLTVASPDKNGAEILSGENRKHLNNQLRELQSHRMSLQELTVSNIAAGTLHFVIFNLNYNDIFYLIKFPRLLEH